MCKCINIQNTGLKLASSTRPKFIENENLIKIGISVLSTKLHSLNLSNLSIPQLIIFFIRS